VETNHVTKAMLLLEKGVKMKKWEFDRDEIFYDTNT
jgi:hypothetical protein